MTVIVLYSKLWFLLENNIIQEIKKFNGILQKHVFVITYRIIIQVYFCVYHHP